MRYAFTRFGVPYVVSIQCLDSTPRPRRLACREAYPVAERFLKALRIAGGQPSRPRTDILVRHGRAADGKLARFQLSPERRHRRQQRRPQTGRPRRPDRLFANPLSAGKDPGLRAFAILRQSANPTSEPSEYPWRDNFCEARSFEVGQCASGFGHQGQDIRAARVPAATTTAARICDPKQQAVVAVRDGVVIRSAKQQAATLQINTRTEHIRFRYMHMNPSAMDADGLLNGRRVAEGEKIGVVSNYLDHPNGTTPPSAFRRAGVHPRRLAVGQSLHHADLGL